MEALTGKSRRASYVGPGAERGDSRWGKRKVFFQAMWNRLHKSSPQDETQDVEDTEVKEEAGSKKEVGEDKDHHVVHGTDGNDKNVDEEDSAGTGKQVGKRKREEQGDESKSSEVI